MRTNALSAKSFSSAAKASLVLPGSGACKLTRSPPPIAAPVRINSRRPTTANALILSSLHPPPAPLYASLGEFLVTPPSRTYSPPSLHRYPYPQHWVFLAARH